MSAHTPGPWVLTEVPCGLGCCTVYDINAQYVGDERPERHITGVVAHANGGNAVWLREGEADANAKLIASAPSLLAALEALLEMDPKDDYPAARVTVAKWMKATDEARAVVAAAKGSP